MCAAGSQRTTLLWSATWTAVVQATAALEQPLHTVQKSEQKQTKATTAVNRMRVYVCTHSYVLILLRPAHLNARAAGDATCCYRFGSYDTSPMIPCLLQLALSDRVSLHVVRLQSPARASKIVSLP